MRNTNFEPNLLGKRQIVLLAVFMIVFSISGFSGNSKNKTSPVKNAPVFTEFIYQGEDQVYKDFPLKADEFYNPILQGCYPDPSITAKGGDYYLVCSSFAIACLSFAIACKKKATHDLVCNEGLAVSRLQR